MPDIAADTLHRLALDLMLTTGGELYTACTNCHEQYLMEQP